MRLLPRLFFSSMIFVGSFLSIPSHSFCNEGRDKIIAQYDSIAADCGILLAVERSFRDEKESAGHPDTIINAWIQANPMYFLTRIPIYHDNAPPGIGAYWQTLAIKMAWKAKRDLANLHFKWESQELNNTQATYTNQWLAFNRISDNVQAKRAFQRQSYTYLHKMHGAFSELHKKCLSVKAETLKKL